MEQVCKKSPVLFKMILREVKTVLLILIISFDFKSVSATSTKEGKTLPTFQNFPSVLQPTYPSQPTLKRLNAKNLAKVISNLDKLPRLEHTSYTMSLSELPPKLRNPQPRLSRKQRGTVYILGQ